MHYFLPYIIFSRFDVEAITNGFVPFYGLPQKAINFISNDFKNLFK
jgi:hypothetical protein